MRLSMHIKDIKSINDLQFHFPLEKGLYAITGENASGKSTLVRCASTVFFNTSLKEYFGTPPKGATIEFELDGSTRTWMYNGKVWEQNASESRIELMDSMKAVSFLATDSKMQPLMLSVD